MDKQIAQALNSLIPKLTGTIPPELSELVASLLAQSRSKASSLKAEEEIARTYACANIACERLKQSLALPRIEPRPPCPPKIYEKLYKYLDGTLPTGTRKSSRPSKGAATISSTPSKHVRPDKPAQPINARRKTSARTASTSEVPSWLMPVIRNMCKELEAPAAPHHIFAGVSSILSSQDPDHSATNVNAQALIITIYILVATRLTGIETGPLEYQHRKKSALTALQKAIEETGEDFACSSADVDASMRQVGEHRWTDMDWFGNVEEACGLDGESIRDAEEQDVDDEDDAEDGHILPMQSKGLVNIGSEEEDYLQAGLGTMMDDRVDLLSDAKRRSYEQWKAEMLLHIEDLEAKDQEIEADG